MLSREEIQEDFSFYRDILENTHPGLYRYNSKQEMQSRLDSLSNLMERDMNFYEYYRLIASFNSSIRCAHSYVIPEKEFEPYAFYKAKSIPFYLYPIDEQMIVLFNGTSEERIKPGFELIAINNRSMKEIRDQMMRMYWADGYNQTGRKLVLEGVMFPAFYYAFIDQPEVFDLQFKDEAGKVQSFKVEAQTFSKTQKMFNKNPINNQVLKVFKNTPKKDWYLKTVKEVDQTAYLRINGFGHEKAISNESSAKIMKDFMEDIIDQLNKKEITNLILDLRDNKGGWGAMSIELYRFLAKSDKQFEFYGKGFAVTNDTSYLKYSDLNAVDIASLDEELIPQEDGTFLINPEFDKNSRGQVPYQKRFKGQLYILVNRGTGSAASEFAAVAKSNEIGIIVGEETGGAYEGDNSTSFLHFELPNSKMYLRTPLVSGELAVKELQEKGKGVMPDFEVDFRKEDLIIRYDRQLEYTKELIKRSK